MKDLSHVRLALPNDQRRWSRLTTVCRLKPQPNIVCLRDAAETPTFFYIFIDL